MLTKNEITAVNLSPTKKDFVQIWNELLEVAGKLSERWDPTSTNESDPGIVILKALAGLADKLNYNIDKNTLEAFMPTAAQEESMRKLCDMLGYNMKYYQSAKTDVTIKYYNPEPSDKEKAAITATAQNSGLKIPKFTTITNGDQDISYFIINTPEHPAPAYISNENPSITFTCMEGQLVKCESINDNNIITINQISENNRFYLPETQIAENGIFIYNIFDIDGVVEDGVQWEKVDNLNIQPRGTRAFKFCFDSYDGRPYLEFPEDYSELFNDGIFIYYARTHGVNGNVSARTLTQLDLPSDSGWADVSASSFSVENVFAATTGSNAETIKQAYNNFKKTVGTFETLVTCRDYMNKIYSMVNNYGKPCVSNILVTDIRSDLNRAVTICSCDSAGIFYKETPIVVPVEETRNVSVPVETNYTTTIVVNANKPVFDGDKWRLGTSSGMELTKSKMLSSSFGFDISMGCDEVKVSEDGYWVIVQNGKEYQTSLLAKEEVTVPVSTTIDETVTIVKKESPAIDHFDVVFYPFKSYNQIKNNVKDIRDAYDSSFTYTEASFADIEGRLAEENIKTIAHNIVRPRLNDIVSITNYLKLNATIVTNSKITTEEGTLIIEGIKIALANAFNMRELDFGEEIPFDSIVEVIEKSDSRIRVASLNEPVLYTTFSVLEEYSDIDGTPVIKEYAVKSDWLTDADAKATDRLNGTFNTKEAKEFYNKLAVRNVLAGRVPLFKYSTGFSTSFLEGAYYQTTTHTDKPALQLPAPDKDTESFTVYTDPETGTIYTGQAFDDKTVYTEINLPNDNNYEGNVITSVGTEADFITTIGTQCRIYPANTDKIEITDVALAQGEFIKFRAPNFTTIKTYPAYVNYHLKLNEQLKQSASFAEATSLFDLLNTEVNWQKVFTFFNSSNSDLVKKFTLSQKISAFKPLSQEDSSQTPQSGVILIDVQNSSEGPNDYTMEQLMSLSGCFKLLNENYTANLAWSPDTSKGETAPAHDMILPNPVQLGYTNPFVKGTQVLKDLQQKIDETISAYRGSKTDGGEYILPTDCSWTISFEFECVPFTAKSLAAWKEFIKTVKVADFTPVEENDTVFWRKTAATGYSEGKYITDQYEKLIKFSGESSFVNLAGTDSNLHNIYVAKSLGSDAIPASIEDGEERMLYNGECLYIEYTPSTTTEDGTTKEMASVTEILGEGTIIKPSGFEQGLVDSRVLESQGTSYVKQISFKDGNTVNMYSLGASEQIEVRDFARVVLTKDSFKDSPYIYIYRNFDSPAMNGLGGSYTLKDGEYIFYTDQAKAEFAYFTSGTEVSVTSGVSLPKTDIIDIATIFDSGIQEIPWEKLYLAAGERVIFQEYQYLTLGNEDVIKSIDLTNYLSGRYLDENWCACDNVTYAVAGATNNIIPLRAVTVGNRPGNGWEVCSTLELDVSKNSAQVLRCTDKVRTSLKLYGSGAGTIGSVKYVGPGIDSDGKYSDEYDDGTATPVKASQMYFKTNVTCQSVGNEVDLVDVTAGIDNIDGFQVKIFAQDAPTIVETESGKVIPFRTDSSKEIDFITWAGEDIDLNNSDMWTHVSLDMISVQEDRDKALRLPVNLLPNTYGIFCIYIEYSDAQSKAWIEALPGTRASDIVLLNTDNYTSSATNESFDKLELHQGINCVCVNTTGRVFIKASENAKGTLYFDELRLVNTAKVSATLNDEQPIGHTLGLNIEQLGYQLINTPNEASKELLIANYVKEAYSKLSDISTAVEKDFANRYALLEPVAKKVDVLVKLEEAITKDLELLKTLDKTTLQFIVTSYNDIVSTLQKENELLSALNSNSSLDEIEQRINKLLESFSGAELLEQQILTELGSLRTATKSDLELLSASDVLADYLAVVSELEEPDTYKDVHTEIVKVANEKVESEFNNKLKAIITEVEQITNADDRARLITALEAMKANEQAPIRAEIAIIVNKLVSYIDQEAMSNLLADIENAASTPDYFELLARLRQLRSMLGSDDLKVLIAEIANAAAAEDNEYLKVLAADLKEIFNPTGSGTNTAAWYNTEYVTPLYTSVINHIKDATFDSEAVNTSIVKSVGDLVTAISEFYSKTLEKLSEALSNQVAALASTDSVLNAAVSTLSNSSKVQIEAIVPKITKAYTARSTMLADLKNFEYINSDYSELTCKQFIVEAIVTVWPTCMLNRLELLLNDVSKVFTTCLSGGTYSVSQSGTILVSEDDLILQDSEGSTLTAESTEVTSLTELFAKYNFSGIVNTDDFIKLFEKVAYVVSVKEQDSNKKVYVANLLNAMPTNVSLSNAINALAADDGTILEELAYALSTSTNVHERRKLITQLRAELTNAIVNDEELKGILADMLSSNILRLTEKIDINDVYYSKLADFVINGEDSLQKTLLASDIDSSTIDTLYESVLNLYNTDKELRNLLKCDKASFIENIGSFNQPDATCITDSVINELVTLKALKKTGTSVQTIMQESLGYTTDFSYLLKDIPDGTEYDVELKNVIKELQNRLSVNIADLSATELELLDTLLLEKQLLEDIRAKDVDRLFYYNVPIETSLAIEFNESNKALNTLMNPMINYDINNVNNNFVISKLDIDYLTKGIQIARSSRLN
jgi:hypothetical protein